ncbi:molybdopterin-dependent oxidoreductase [Ilumatobacter sp.]|uniref:molybdopterin-dependent oxidoreductase n=1 Tax=Ilumatobacter sp. TaxID=1967498 RepID=UPI003AF8170C
MHDRLYGSRWHGIAIGLLSTFAGLAAAELVVGLVRGAMSPVVPVGQEVIDVVPPAVKDWAIDWFGTADKAVLILGTLLSLAVIGSIVGNLAVKGNRAAAYAVTIVVGVIGVFAVWMRPAPDFGKMLPPIVGTFASLVVIWWLSPRDIGPDGAIISGPSTDQAAEPQVDGALAMPRRSFVQAASVVGLVSVMVGGLGRVLRDRFEVGDERAALQLPEPVDTIAPPPTTDAGSATTADVMDFGIDEVESFVVPNSDFYRIDTALVVPQVPKDSWRLRIHGMVDNDMELTFADLLARDQVERYITLSCVSNEVGGGLVGNARFQGVLMKDVLDEAGVQPGATQVVSRSIDGWNCGSPTSAIMDGRDAMFAIAMNGEPLPAEHGYPVRLVVPGLYGYVSATKWVTEIELTRWEDFDGYWVPRGWSKEGPVKTMARIDRPGNGKGYTPNGDGVVDIAGLAWAVHRGISRVEVSIDDGDWLECELAGVPSDDTWRQWRYRWTDSTPGEHTVRARAFDGDGVPQPEEPKSVAPDGAQGYHRVRFEVDA